MFERLPNLTERCGGTGRQGNQPYTRLLQDFVWLFHHLLEAPACTVHELCSQLEVQGQSDAKGACAGRMCRYKSRLIDAPQHGPRKPREGIDTVV